SVLSGDLNGDDNPDNFDNHGENATHVVIGAGDIGVAALDGFTVTGGSADDGSTPYIYVYGAEVYSSGAGGGGGLINVSKHLAVNNTVFRKNRVTHPSNDGGTPVVGLWGGGVLSNANITLTNVIITE